MKKCSVLCVLCSVQLEREVLYVERSHRQGLLTVHGGGRRQENRSSPAALRASAHVLRRRRPHDVPRLRRPRRRDCERQHLHSLYLICCDFKKLFSRRNCYCSAFWCSHFWEFDKRCLSLCCPVWDKDELSSETDTCEVTGVVFSPETPEKLETLENSLIVLSFWTCT